MKRIIVILLLLGVCFTSYGQRRYAADRYFKEFAYSKSAELYQQLYDKGDQSYQVISRLADSYYFTSTYTKAEDSYKKLMEQYEGVASPEHFFRYAQVLKSNGNVPESDKWLLKLKSLKGDDSRVLALEANKQYFSEYTNRPKTYVNIHNLAINTKYSDFGSFVDGGYLYFSSTRADSENKKLYKWNNQPYLNIYKSEEQRLQEGGSLDVGASEKIESLSSKFHESNAIISKDGTTLYFTRDNASGNIEKTAKLKIYRAKKQYDDTWGAIEELPFNSDDYSSGHPSLSADEGALYFVSDMPGGYGATDLYQVSISEDGTFGEPENLGKTINTEGREMFPYIGSNNRLYFASDGHLGLGALDIFESKLEGLGYGEPVNLGAPINGPLDDFSFIIDKDRKAGYFSSNREGGKGDDDIYSFRIYQCKEAISGVVSENKTGTPISGVSVRLIDDKGEPISEQITSSDGGYSFTEIDCERKYIVVASKPEYLQNQLEQTTLDIDKKQLQANIALESLIVEDQIVINPIYFDFNLESIRADAEYELEHIVSVMKSYPEMIIRIESHTDSRGTSAYNKSLSQRRANSTRDYIVSRGISLNRIESAVGYGERQLLNNCGEDCTEEEHEQNRRSYFFIVKGADNVKSSN
ncbi:Outer membrane protein OmpA [Tenacibaculum sp. MAR_2009_124]|uniref:OmpA family protein n=1 Tax=Tenacibaculum sp. MAR_2009_124 TaxID=1250059 RepID=UPI00089B4BD5|nr:OmpA family protein [Tenacibaculum sp. MAR_2009_124]SEC03182.1 Outer membrane protein OmpA [Tenacibaculum sp. MAR_2009_124]